MDEMDDKNPTYDPLTFLYDQRRDTALQLAALADRVTRGELAGVWAVAMPLEGKAEIVGLVESRHDEIWKRLREDGDPGGYEVVAELPDCLQPGDDCEPVADKNLSFSAALVAAKAGHTIRREGWNGAGLNVCLYWPYYPVDNAPPGTSKPPTTVPFFVIINPPTHATAPNLRSSWVPSQTDMLAEDWLIVPGVRYVF